MNDTDRLLAAHARETASSRALSDVAHALRGSLQAHLDLPHAVSAADGTGARIIAEALEAEPHVRALLDRLSAIANARETKPYVPDTERPRE